MMRPRLLRSVWAASSIVVTVLLVIHLGLNFILDGFDSDHGTSKSLAFDRVIRRLCPRLTRSVLLANDRNYTTEAERFLLETDFRNHYSLDQVLERTITCENVVPYHKRVPSKGQDRTSHVFAFSILVHNDIGLLETQLKMLFRPQHSFCIHLDAKASEDMRAAVKGILACYQRKYPRTFMSLAPHPYAVYWGEDTILKGDLKCLEILLKHSTPRESQIALDKGPSWDYVLSLAGTELPLKPPEEISRVLRRNFPFGESFAISRYDEVDAFDYKSRYTYKWVLDLNKTVDPYDPYFHYMANTKIRKTPPPHGLKICKGPRNVILNRTVADFMVNHPVSRDLLDWMRTMLIPEEGFYSTLIRARVTQLHNGSYSVTQDLKEATIEPICPRYALWKDRNEINEVTTPPTSTKASTQRPRSLFFPFSLFRSAPEANGPKCHGEYVHQVCNFGLGDLPRMVDPTVVDCLFINKFNLKYDATAVACWEEYAKTSW